jgi:hypothetical protein
MVKNDRENAGFISIALGFFTLIWGAFFLTSLNDKNENKWNYLFSAVAYLALTIFSFVQARRWKPMNYRRQLAAVSGFAAHVPLAQPHPLPNVAALPLPFTIKLKPNWPKLLIALGVPLALAISMDTYDYRVHGEHITNIQDPFIWVLDIIPLLAVSLMMALWLRPQRIEVTTEGLTVRHANGRIGGTDRIPWSDARLFAVRDGKPGMPATHYELSCSYAVVQWTRTRNHPWSLHRPTIPFAEYNAQMEALIALITGITGLPLYDVR